jgi:hypothetical protein
VYALEARTGAKSSQGGQTEEKKKWKQENSLPFEVAVHNREEDLEEEVDGVYQYRQQVQPRFARHHDIGIAGVCVIKGDVASCW